MKPRFGAGSQDTFLIRNRDVGPGFPAWPSEQRALRPGWKAWPHDNFIVQQYVLGEAASVALLIAPGQAIPLMPARQHLSSDGRFRYLGGSLPLQPGLALRATKVALAAVAGIAGLQGYVGVDLVLGDDGYDWAIEINPRLTTSYIGLRRAVPRQSGGIDAALRARGGD